MANVACLCRTLEVLGSKFQKDKQETRSASPSKASTPPLVTNGLWCKYRVPRNDVCFITEGIFLFEETIYRLSVVDKVFDNVPTRLSYQNFEFGRNTPVSIIPIRKG